ncbi:MAG: response regulator [Pseudohongiellaceae bacterium]
MRGDSQVSTPENTTSLLRRITVPVTLMLLVAVMVGSAVLAIWQRQLVLDQYTEELSLINRSLEQSLIDGVEVMRSGVTTLSQLGVVTGIMRASNNNDIDPVSGLPINTGKQLLFTTFRALTAFDPNYYSIRFIGAADGGRELVRIDIDDGALTQVMGDELEQVGDTEYFRAVSRIAENELYFSRIDLHRETGSIVIPARPTLRVAAPVFSDDGSFFGAIVINRDMGKTFEDLYERFRLQFPDPAINLYITNNNGDYLFHPDPSRTFGFEFGESYRWQDDFVDIKPLGTAAETGTSASEVDFSSGLARADLGGEQVYTYFHEIQLVPESNNLQVLLISEIPAGVVNGPIMSILQRMILINLIAGLAIYLAFRLILARQLEPLSTLSSQAGRIAEGDYNVALPASKTTEVSALISSLSSLMKRVAEREAGLIKSENFANNVIDTAPQGIMISDHHGEIVRVNSKLEEMFGYAHGEMNGLRISNLVPVQLQELHETKRLEYLESPDTRVMNNKNIFGLRKDGSQIAVEVGITPVNFEAESRILATVVDMSKYWKIEQQLIRNRNELESKVRERTQKLLEARDEAKQLVKAKSEFLANMSHEIRTPMTAVLGLLDVLRRTSLDPAQQKYVSQIHNSSRALLHIINDILDISKIEAGKISIEENDFSLVEAVESAVDLFAPSADLKGLTLLLKIDPGLPRHVRGDRTRLMQVLNNLLDNAIKFTEKGEVLLKVECMNMDKHTMNLRFTVSDTGIGIDPETIKRLVLPFEQADSATTRLFGGTGLGLTISKKLIELMGGSLHIKSQVATGTEFSFLLKLAYREGSDLLLKEPQHIGKHVLVVDDHPIACEIISRLLSHWGCRVDSAFSGHQALQKLQELTASNEHYDLMIVDWRMPVMDGYKLIAKVRSLYQEKVISTLPQVLMVTEAELSTLKQAENYQDDVSVLTKPVTISRLLTTLTELDWIELVVEESENGHRARLEALLRNGLKALTTPPKILLVEDNLTNQIVIKELLAGFRLEISLADNGREGVEKIRQEHFDLVLMDLQMPIMDGFEATREIRKFKSREQLPILALSAATFAEDVIRSDQVGMNDHLNKPIDIEILLSSLLHWLPLNKQPQMSADTEIVKDLRNGQIVEERNKAIIEALLSNPSFNLSDTLYSHGNTAAYLRILEAFISEFGSMLINWESQRGWSNEEMQRFAHSVRGSAGSIGAIELSRYAGKVEASMKAGDETGMPPLMKMLRKVLETVGWASIRIP